MSGMVQDLRYALRHAPAFVFSVLLLAGARVLTSWPR
jgi:hypothetical protein